MKTYCPLCKKLYITNEHMEKHMDKDHPDWRIPKQRGWVINGCFMDFSEPVTEEEARALAEEFQKRR